MLRLALPEDGLGCSVALDVHPFTAGAQLPAQRIGIRVNGRDAGGTVATGPTMLEFGLGEEPAPPDTIIQLDLPDAARPMDHEPANGDGRTLGLDLRRVVVRGTVRKPGVTPGPRLPSLLELLAGFESLGEGCEFDRVQRACGVRPSRRFGFGGPAHSSLLAAVQAGFGGMASSDTACAALGTASERMVLVHCDTGLMGQEEVASLAAAIRAHGPSVLLWVTADPAQRIPSVAWAEPGLLQGTLRQFAPPGDAGHGSLGDWMTLCRATMAMLGSADLAVVERPDRSGGR